MTPGESFTVRYPGKGNKRSILKCLIASLNVSSEFLYDTNFITVEVVFFILYEGGDLGLRNRDFWWPNLAVLAICFSFSVKAT